MIGSGVVRESELAVMEPFAVTLPAASTLKSVVVAKPIVEDEMMKVVGFQVDGRAARERFANGDVVPIPRLPLVARKSVEVPVMVLVPEKYGNCPVVPVYSDEVAILSEVAPEALVIEVKLEPVRQRPKVGLVVPTDERFAVPLPYMS